MNNTPSISFQVCWRIVTKRSRLCRMADSDKQVCLIFFTAVIHIDCKAKWLWPVTQRLGRIAWSNRNWEKWQAEPITVSYVQPCVLSISFVFLVQNFYIYVSWVEKLFNTHGFSLRTSWINQRGCLAEQIQLFMYLRTLRSESSNFSQLPRPTAQNLNLALCLLGI